MLSSCFHQDIFSHRHRRHEVRRGQKDLPETLQHLIEFNLSSWATLWESVHETESSEGPRVAEAGGRVIRPENHSLFVGCYIRSLFIFEILNTRITDKSPFSNVSPIDSGMPNQKGLDRRKGVNDSSVCSNL